jgi:hypothetical protein
MVKPLKELIAQADRYLGETKLASAARVPDEVSSLADTLAFASQIEEGLNIAETQGGLSDLEARAVEMNKIAAQIELDVYAQVAQFGIDALASGYTEEQVEEALSKIAAKKLHKHLGTLSAMSGLGLGGEDKNSLKPSHSSKAVGGEKISVPLTKSLGGAR